MKGTRWLGWSLAALLSLGSGRAQEARMSCAELLSLTLPDVRITEAEPVPAKPEGEAITAPHCRVSGVIDRENRFRLLLPEAWNGRFFMGGGGGFVGLIVNSAETTVNLGYATAGTDTGHEANPLSGAWALNEAERQVNFGHLAVHRTAEVSKALIRAFYGSDPDYAYFSGCSRGGGQALMEAQRYPDDFDGLIAGAPAFDWTGFTAEMLQNMQLHFPDPNDLSKRVITPDNLALLETRILAACDALDGVTDEVMEDPTRCPFTPDDLPACPSETPSPECVTSAQREAIRRIYDPATGCDGTIYPGQPMGGESRPAGWPMWITGQGQMPSGQYIFGTEFARYFVFGDPEWDYSTYDFATWEQDSRAAASIVNATDPDLSRFKQGGGKLILWHGWSDPALPAGRSIAYYGEVKGRDANVDDYFRLFLLPGVEHCETGPGPDQVDWVSRIVDWVEHDRAPERVTASKLDASGAVVRTRPLCPYPEQAVYRGSGNTDDADSFSCAVP